MAAANQSMHTPRLRLAAPAVIFDAAEDFDLEAFAGQRADRGFIDRLHAFKEQEQVALLILLAVQFDHAELAGDGQDAFEILFATSEADVHGPRDARDVAIGCEIGENFAVRLPLGGEARFVNGGQVLAHAATGPLRPSTNRLNR